MSKAKISSKDSCRWSLPDVNKTQGNSNWFKDIQVQSMQLQLKGQRPIPAWGGRCFTWGKGNYIK